MMRSVRYHGKELPRKIEDPDRVSLFESVEIIYSTLDGFKDNLAEYTKHVKFYTLPGAPLVEPGTLREIETWFVNRYGEMLPCTVLTEYGVRGVLYRYGNHGNYWEEIGETCGYA